MRFSGHETFAIRDGWLHKGLRLVIEQPERMLDEQVADWLGVGRNMARSIKHWLVAASLVEELDGKGKGYTPTSLGKLIYKHDRYFAEVGTWWAVHINLVRSKQTTGAWSWFFNSFGETRFERGFCLDHYTQYAGLQTKRIPSKTTLQKDLSCLLASYARRIPEERQDVEEANDCPLIELGLLNYFKNSGTHQSVRERKDIPPELLGYCFAASNGNGEKGAKNVEVTLHHAASAPGGPGRCFLLTSESLHDQISESETIMNGKGLRLFSLGGERAVRFSRKPAEDWLRSYYRDLS